MPNLTDPPIHATTIASYGIGVLILGPSGSGKSTLALQLMAYGAELVADDRTLLSLREDAVWASRPETLPQMIEARGVGLLPVACHGPVRLGLVVDMGKIEKDRLPPARRWEFRGQSVALLHKSEETHFSAAILQYLKSNHVS
ncbi:MAG: HPr kinase/phosphorylase [Mangrovicoccus sp.]